MNPTFRLALTCLSLLVAAHPAAAEESALRGVFVSEAPADAKIDQAIETAVAKMNFIKRPIARGRLKKTNPAYARVELAGTADEFSVKFDDRKSVQIPLTGKPVMWARDDGEKFEVMARHEGSQIVQTFKSPDGQRINRFSLGADGKLTMDVTVSSEQLPAPVHYDMTFVRSTH
ncbi:MAG: hypothetical protein ABW106_04365 [Steroidobacteraceae bacterium]